MHKFKNVLEWFSRQEGEKH